ncbi:MAG: redoxin family protein [Pirellula sp.]|jgi:thiol-disulfide isomerase/thioredoxin|nr:redoxin family protein [Pirellula sp.]
MLNPYNQSIAMALISIIASAVSAQQPPVAVIREQTGVLNFTDTDGNEHAVPCKKGTRGVVLVFINTECPIANAYHPTLRRLREEFSDSRFDFVMVHADANLKTDAARKHQKDYEITWPIVLDSGNKIARHVEAKVTPEAIVVDAKGDVLYRGRIDDRYQDYGRKRPEPSTHDLKVAMQAIVEGKSVPTPETKAIGCVIRYVD